MHRASPSSPCSVAWQCHPTRSSTRNTLVSHVAQYLANLASDAATLVYERAFATQDGAIATVAIFLLRFVTSDKYSKNNLNSMHISTY